MKNKIAPPFKEAEFDIMFGQGISREGDILDLASDLGVINKSGAWYSYNGEKIGQGRENAKNFLKENPQIRDNVEQKVRDHFKLDGGSEEEEQKDGQKGDSQEETGKKTPKKEAEALNNMPEEK